MQGIERMLAADVKAVTDGGGEFAASLRPIRGRAQVARFFARLASSRRGGMAVSIRSINEFPTALFDFASPRGRRVPRLALSLDLDRQGLVAQVRVVANSTKLAALRRHTDVTPATESHRLRPPTTSRKLISK